MLPPSVLELLDSDCELLVLWKSVLLLELLELLLEDEFDDEVTDADELLEELSDPELVLLEESDEELELLVLIDSELDVLTEVSELDGVDSDDDDVETDCDDELTDVSELDTDEYELCELLLVLSVRLDSLDEVLTDLELEDEAVVLSSDDSDELDSLLVLWKAVDAELALDSLDELDNADGVTKSVVLAPQHWNSTTSPVVRPVR